MTTYFFGPDAGPRMQLAPSPLLLSRGRRHYVETFVVGTTKIQLRHLGLASARSRLRELLLDNANLRSPRYDTLTEIEVDSLETLLAESENQED